MDPAAVLLDVDGTLVDTTYLHTLAWFRALRHAGLTRPMAEVHRLVGMGADTLLERMCGEPRQDLADAWEREFDRLKRDIVEFPGVDDLLQSLRKRGVRIAVTTSGLPRDVAQILELIDADDLIDVVVHSGEVSRSKPAPDLFLLASERLGVPANRSVVVGDTVWDVEAAEAAGLPAVAVLTGGIAEAELRSAGAVAVYRDVAELVEQLDTSPIARLFT
jgi:HAD superfamily hydrolase (TIGR01509 family)